MTEIDAAVVRRRLVAMRELLAHLESLGAVTEDDLRRDLGLRLQVTMAVAQLVTLASEINAYVARLETGSAPADLRGGFEMMARRGWISDDLATALGRAPGMRNVIIHEYVEVDLGLIAAAVPLSRDQFTQYVRQVAAGLPIA